jgi:hypothetical protein
VKKGRIDEISDGTVNRKINNLIAGDKRVCTHSGQPKEMWRTRRSALWSHSSVLELDTYARTI